MSHNPELLYGADDSVYRGPNKGEVADGRRVGGGPDNTTNLKNGNESEETKNKQKTPEDGESRFSRKSLGETPAHVTAEKNTIAVNMDKALEQPGWPPLGGLDDTSTQTAEANIGGIEGGHGVEAQA